jgi:hypothetical protein
MTHNGATQNSFLDSADGNLNAQLRVSLTGKKKVFFNAALGIFYSSQEK